MSGKVKLKYTFEQTIEVQRSWYNGNHVNEALDGNQGTDEHIIAIESENERLRQVIEEQVMQGEGTVKVELVQ